MDDTTPEIAEKIREICRMKSPAERFKMGCSMYETSKYLVTQAILREDPGISASELRKEIFLRFYRDDFEESELQKILAFLDSTSSEKAAQ
jgi:hypothetical protein